MTKKILIIIAGTLIILVIGLFIWAFMISRQSGGEVTVQESFRELVSFGERSDFFSRRGTDEFDTDLGTSNTLDGDNRVLSRLRQISNFPVAGAAFLENKNLSTLPTQAGEETLIRFIARENGHIFEVRADSTTQKRISNTTILRIWDTKWLSGGGAFVARFLDDESSEIESFYAEIKEPEASGEGEIDGVFLPNNIKELTLSSDDKIFYLVSIGDGSVGIIADADGDGKVQVFDSLLSEWNIQWAGGDKIALTTKPSAGISGYLYFLDSKTEKLEKILSGIAGLTTLVNKDATHVLFTQNEGNRLLLRVLDIEEETITDLPLWTLSEKCIWSELNENIIYCGVPNIIPRADNLDLWYQGLISFSDSIWMIDIQTQTASILADPRDIANREIDLIKPILSADENYLIFTNKKDSTLWQLKF